MTAPALAAVTVSGAGFTTTLMGADGLTSKIVSPPKVAVTECEPAESRDVVKVAVNGALPVRLAEPRVSEPSVKVTVPVGFESTHRWKDWAKQPR